MNKERKLGDVYYEKHTVVGISKRTGEVSETEVETIDVIPKDEWINKVKQAITNIQSESFTAYGDYDDPCSTLKVVEMQDVLTILGKLIESEDKG